MRKPPPWTMELLLMIALCIAVILGLFAIREPEDGRTRFVPERSEFGHVARERRAPADDVSSHILRLRHVSLDLRR